MDATCVKSAGVGLRRLSEISRVYHVDGWEFIGWVRGLGAEFDIDGHEGQLQIIGADEHLKRYARTIRQLRNMSYSTVVVVTDQLGTRRRRDRTKVIRRNNVDKNRFS
jgi:hypothetical protein